jgi:hypothetical protein
MSVIPRMVMAFLATSCGAHARDLAELGPLHASAGEAVSGYLEVPASGGQSVRGSRYRSCAERAQGRCWRWSPEFTATNTRAITALQRLRQSIDPRALRGTLILVHIANPPSFYGRTIYASPADGKNLNRVFPGRPDGTLSERIAYAITTQVIAKADFLVDLHGATATRLCDPMSTCRSPATRGSTRPAAEWRWLSVSTTS